MTADASLVTEQLAALGRVSRGPVDAARGTERPNVGDHLPDLIAREEDSRHGGAGDAIGDVEKNIGVGGAVEKYASLEVGSAASFAFQSVALGAMRSKDFGACGDVNGSSMRVLDLAVLATGDGGKQHQTGEPHMALTSFK